MDTLMKADIFFFISSIATIVISILASVLLYYLIRTGKNLNMLLETLKSDYKESEEFVEELRERLEDNPIFRFFFPPSRRRRSTTKKSGTKK